LPLGQIIIQKYKSQNKKKAKKVLVAKLLESKKKRINKRSGTLKGRRSALVDLHEIQRLPSFSSFIKCNFHEQGSY
jgi:protein subunit release factor A